MSLAQEVKIHSSGLVDLTTFEDNKTTSITCNLSDYVNYMSSMFTSMQTPLLPQYCRFYAKKKEKVCVVLERPSFVAKQLKTIYGTLENVVIPASLWFFDLNEKNDGHLTTSYVYLFHMGSLEGFSMDLQMSHFIFPHYSVGYRGICWGDKTTLVHTISSKLQDIGRLPDLFFATTSSDHLQPQEHITRSFQQVANSNNVPRLPGYPDGFGYVYDIIKNAPHLIDSALTKSNKTPRMMINSILGENNEQ